MEKGRTRYEKSRWQMEYKSDNMVSKGRKKTKRKTEKEMARRIS